MGTAGYMSPEQARGQVVDHRSDIFSYGAILYEMISGQRAFQGNSVVEVMNAILKEEPPELPPNRSIAPALERIVRHCLEKSPEQRFQSAGDIAFDLEALSGSTPATLAVAPGRLKHRERLAWIVAAVAVFTALVLAVAYFRRAQIDTPVLKLSVLQPKKETSGYAISPDGRRLAFVATAEGKTMLWVRPLDSLTAQALPGTEGADHPFWSPDSRFIGFFAQSKLKKIEIAGGPAQTVCEAADPRGGTWNRDGVIVFAPNSQDALYRVSSSGGGSTSVTTLDRSGQENAHRWPHFLPDGRHFIYFVRSAQRDWQGCYLGSLDSKEKRRLLTASGSVAYAAGYLLFVREGTLLAHAFDPNRLQITGEPIPVAEQVEHHRNFFSEFSVSDSGVLAYQHGSDNTTRLIWLDRGGKQHGPTLAPANFNAHRLSPDEKRVAGNRLDDTGATDIWLLELSRGITSRFTSDPAYEWLPVWSPDGSRIVFNSNRKGSMDLYLKALSGAGREEVLLESNTLKVPTDWSRDGRFILYEDADRSTNKSDLWVLPLFGDRQPMPFLQTPFDERQGQFSPNGQWIAYVSDESGRYEVCVESFPARSKVQISTDGGIQPRWRRDGNELFYLAADGKVMAVEVRAGSTFEATVPKVLFVAPLGPRDALAGSYSVTADGQRFLFNSFGEEISGPITVVINWTGELRKKLN
jgi:Tol biopolymer transport system component